jgi:hypothetical protein
MDKYEQTVFIIILNDCGLKIFGYKITAPWRPGHSRSPVRNGKPVED